MIHSAVGGRSKREKSLARYAALQALNLAFCWGWFAVLGLVALTQYNLDEIAFWLLFGGACAGLYGLRPNVEKAIDMSWAGDVATAASRESAEKLKPVKRRIDMAFSIIVLVLLVLFLALWTLQIFQRIGSG
jgi:hypothetical protein